MWCVLPTSIGGVMSLQPDPARDSRGNFTRLSCVATLAEHDIAFVARQTSLSRSVQRGTLRGMHLQTAPSEETKIVHCVSGAIFDVALDLRVGSPTFLRAFTIELSAENALGLLIPRGCAHGMMTLTDNAAVLYQIDRDHDPLSSRGVRWNDPAFGIQWPMTPVELSDRDAAWPDFAV